MLKLIARRLAALPLILLVVAAATFGLVAASGIDPVNAYVGVEDGVGEEAKLQIARSWGFDQPIYEQFGRWLGNVAQGDLGNSIAKGGQPVAGEISSRLGATALLVGGALLLTLVGGLVFGVLAAAFRGTKFDWVVRALCFFNVSAPGFWIGLLLLYLFSIKLGWFPAGGTSDVRAVGDGGGVDLKHLLLPMCTLALTQYAWFTLFVRNTLLEVLREDHVQFSRAQGIGELALLLRHALPSALVPFVTLIGTNLAELIGGSVLIESVFGWPGIGLLTRDAALSVDIPLLVAITLLASVLVVLGNLLADVLYRVMDPRVREALG